MKTEASFNTTDPYSYMANNRGSDCFSDLLDKFRLKKGISVSKLCKDAEISRQYYYKLTGQKSPNVSKNAAIACALALRLDRADTDALLESAGFVLSRTFPVDLLAMYYADRPEIPLPEIKDIARDYYEQAKLGSRKKEMDREQFGQGRVSVKEGGDGILSLLNAISLLGNGTGGGGEDVEGLGGFAGDLSESFGSLADKMEDLAASLALTYEEQEAVDSMTDEETALAAPYIATLNGIADILNNAALDIAGIDVGEE